jgi:transcriptional regulator with XRE-family HTH domain
MSILDTVKQGIARLAREHGGPSALAEKAGVGQPNVSKFLSGKAIPRFDTIARMLETLGAKVVFPDEERDTTKSVVFVAAKRPGSVGGAEASQPAPENYMAIPLAQGVVAAGPGLIPEDAVRGWVLAMKDQSSIRYRSNLVALEIGRNQESMVPTLHPLDIVLVDRDDFRPEPDGSIFLVRDPGPDAEVAVKRVYTSRKDAQTLVTFVSDNPDKRSYPPSVFSLESDYQGDLRRAIVGRVVWAWSDMTRK